jgi:hypothetical protein
MTNLVAKLTIDRIRTTTRKKWIAGATYVDPEKIRATTRRSVDLTKKLEGM